LFSLISVNLFAFSLNVETVNAYQGQIIIQADGSVTPETAPIQQIGNLYLVTDDIDCDSGITILILKSNVVVDGQGHTLTGTRQYSNIGIYVGTSHAPANETVTINNFEIKNFYYGITIDFDCPNIVIHNNTISSMAMGIFFSYGGSLSAEITENIISECNYGIDSDWYGLTHTKISKNAITSNKNGIMFNYNSGENIVTENNITNNDEYGIFAEGAQNDYIAGNNLFQTVLASS